MSHNNRIRRGKKSLRHQSVGSNRRRRHYEAWTSGGGYSDHPPEIGALLAVDDDEEHDKLTGGVGRHPFYEGLGDRLAEFKVKRQPRRVLLWAIILLVLGTSAAHAINIGIALDANPSENPSWDPQGTLLWNTFHAAAQIWEDLLPGGGNYDVSVEWDDDIGVLGLWTENPFGDNIIEVNSSPNLLWYYDGPLFANEEFTMEQIFYRDLSPTQKSNWFNGNVPDLLEVGFQGPATTAAAMNRIDLLSVALHELGHELGINYELDGEFEMYPAHLLGRTNVSADADNDISFDGISGHLSAGNSLMFAAIPAGLRRLPSAVDVLTIAYDQSITNVDLARKEYIAGGTYWSDASRWIGGAPPDASDIAYLRSTGLVSMTGTSSAHELYLTGESVLLTSAHVLGVGTVTVAGPGALWVSADGRLDAVDLIIESGGSVLLDSRMDVARTNIASGALFTGGGILYAGSWLRNEGTIRVLQDRTLKFSPDYPAPDSLWDLDGASGTGAVDAQNGSFEVWTGGLTDGFSGSMTVGPGRHVYIGHAWSLDGDLSLQGGAALATAAELRGGAVTFSQATVHVDGFAAVNASSTLWQYSSVVNLAAGANLELSGPAEVFSGAFAVASGGRLRFQSDTRLSNGSFTGTGGGVVELNGATEYAGGTLNVVGVVHQDGNATVSGPTTINGTGIWDLDGTGGATTWNVNDDLTINASRLENEFFHYFGGRINLNGNGTTMTVNTSSGWTMTGRLDIDDGAVLGGSAQMNVTGTIIAESGRIDAPVSFRPEAAVNVIPSRTLQLDGTTYYQGGSYRGAAIQQDGAANVTASATLGQNTYTVPPGGAYPTTQYINWLEQFTWDGSRGASAVTNISPGVTFIINAVKIAEDPVGDGYDGTVNINGGMLSVNTGVRIPTDLTHPWTIAIANVAPTPWRLDGTMNLQQVGEHAAVVQAYYPSPLVIYGEVNALAGLGVIQGMPLTLAPTGSVNVSNGATLALGVGLNAQGALDVEPGGLLRLISAGTLQSSVQMTVDGAAELTSGTTFQGGSYEGDGVLRQSGSANFSQTTRLGISTEFLAGGTNTIAAGQQLQLASNGRVEAGATFQGDGSLRNLAGSELNLLDGAEVEVHLINEGTLRAGSSPGTAIVDRFTQTTSGRLEIEIGGTAAGQFDALIVNSVAKLGGMLDVVFVEPTSGGGVFEPAPGDSFEFLSVEHFAGSFSNVRVGSRLDTSDGMGSFQLDFDPASGSLILASFEMSTLNGDFNRDGKVDAKDFLAWQRGASPNPLSTSDFAAWQANYGAVLPFSATPASIPEPSSAILLIALASIRILTQRSGYAMKPTPRDGPA